MNCEDVNQVLDAYSAESLSGPLRLSVETHLGECAACGKELARIRKTVELLRGVRIPELPADLAVRLTRNAVMQSEMRARQRSVYRFAAFAATAVIAIGAMIGIAHWPQDVAPAPSGISAVALTAGVVSTVALEFNSKQALQDVRFVVEIPDGFELAGHEGRRRVTWSGDLEPGSNRLNLRLKSQPGADGVLVASVSRNESKKIFRVQLRAAPESAPAAVRSGTPDGVESTAEPAGAI